MLELLLLYMLELYPGDWRLSPERFPGRLLLVLGVRLSLGRSVGGLGAGWLAERLGYESLFGGAAVLCIAAIVPIFRLLRKIG